jgi:uncharacterized protein with NAD-binding domain and iron-sulfur cluster
MTESTRNTRVAILGGGMAAMTAAYQLSEHPEYDVSVYSIGWRLGGQGSSGRNLDQAARIEEHGLHLWFGFYENAFNVMRRCYKALGRAPREPLATIDDAFKAINELTLVEGYAGKRLPWHIQFPVADFQPGDENEAASLWDSLVLMIKWMAEYIEKTPLAGGTPQPPKPANIFERIWQWLLRLLTGKPAAPAASNVELQLPEWLITTIGNAEAVLDEEIDRAETWLLRQAVQFAQALAGDIAQHGKDDHNALVWLITEAAKRTWAKAKDQVTTNDEARRLWIIAYLGATMTAGILQDRLLFDGFGNEDRVDLTEWLYQHQLIDDPLANDLTYKSDVLQTYYDLTFHFEDGDTNKPRAAAGVSLVTLLRMFFGYKGSLLWHMDSAMGDTVFAPLYQVLARRGVKFNFFSRVVSLGLSADKTALDTVTISRQINLKVGSYDPLVLVKGLPSWPSEPLYDQIVEGKTLREQHIDLERSLGWGPWKDTGGEITLKAGEDFDYVILGIGIGALDPICTELKAASQKWADMLGSIKTVQTQAIQLWFKPDSAELGVPQAIPVTGGYVEPFSSLTDFTNLIAYENWPEQNQPHYLIYSCGVLKHEPGETQENSQARVKQTALDFLQHEAAPLWPKGTRHDDPNGLNWSNLTAPDNLQGIARFDAQYWRANVDPIERYVLSLPNTNQYRIKADQSGFNHLILTGNWIDTGFNIACIESAAIAGMQAARALTGEPAYIVGEKDTAV